MYSEADPISNENPATKSARFSMPLHDESNFSVYDPVFTYLPLIVSLFFHLRFYVFTEEK